MKKNLTVGLIKGRHDLPVQEYIFDNIEDVLNFDDIHRQVVDFLKKEVGVEVGTGLGLNGCGNDDVAIFRGKKALTVYVTGLTAATAAVIQLCALNGVELTLMHYDSVVGDYKAQRIF